MPRTRAQAPRRLTRAASLTLGVGVVALLAELVLIVIGSGSPELRAGFATTASFAAGTAILLRGAGKPAGFRAPWIVLGLGGLSYSLGSLVFFYLTKGLPTFPSTADLCWLAFYPLVVAAVVLLMRQQRTSGRLGISLDAAIVAVALGALGYRLIFNGFVDAGSASTIVGGQLSYSVLDFGVLVMLAFLCLPSHRRIGGAYIALGAGLLVFLLGDMVLVRAIARGDYPQGTLLDTTWPTGLVLLAVASCLKTSLHHVSALRGKALYAAVVLGFAVAFALLVDALLTERNLTVIGLASAALFLLVLRLLASLRENERLSRDNESIIGAAGEGILRIDLDRRINYANPAALEMLGYFSSPEVLGRHAHELMHHTRADGEPYPAGECPIRHSLREGRSQRVSDELFWRRDGSSIPVDYTSAPLRERGHIVGAVIVFDDVTEQRQLSEQLREQADHDGLTGLCNRRHFVEELSGQLSYAQRYARPGVLLLLDLDDFKLVNDSFGHPVGDRVLCDVAEILTASVRETDVVARIGGDEFAVLLREASEAEGGDVAAGLAEAIKAKADPGVGASIGLASFDGGHERTADELLISADVALYEAKDDGGGRGVVHAGQTGQMLTWVKRIRIAIEEGRLTVYAQPIIDVRTGRVVREELLVRMLDAHGDVIPPAAFLPTAERFGLIEEIDLVVLEHGIELARQGRAVAINVSARTLGDARYVPILEAALSEGLEPSRFNFELTETAAVTNLADLQRFAARLCELGCSLALDDFGTGFSPLLYLKQIHAQYLKIDTEFIRELSDSPTDQRVVQAIVSIGRSFGQQTVAEGVEDEATLRLVRELGVDFAQGFHIGRPAPTEPTGPRREPDSPVARTPGGEVRPQGRRPAPLVLSR
jgi:diguanylate cyclase (GGDEF)-like protein/PAS domain S-box-containing protein